MTASSPVLRDREQVRVRQPERLRRFGVGLMTKSCRRRSARRRAVDDRLAVGHEPGVGDRQPVERAGLEAHDAGPAPARPVAAPPPRWRRRRRRRRASASGPTTAARGAERWPRGRGRGRRRARVEPTSPRARRRCRWPTGSAAPGSSRDSGGRPDRDAAAPSPAGSARRIVLEDRRHPLDRWSRRRRRAGPTASRRTRRRTRRCRRGGRRPRRAPAPAPCSRPCPARGRGRSAAWSPGA